MKSAKRRGTSFENEMVKRLEELGFSARRQPFSGALLDWPHDVAFRSDAIGELVAECKKRRDGQGFNQLERWLGAADILFLRRNHREPFVCMDWRVFELIATAALSAHEGVEADKAHWETFKNLIREAMK